MVNKVILVGRLGADPELKFTQSGRAVCNVSVATNRRWYNDQDELIEETEWHRVVLWGSTAEFAGKYLMKGRQVYVEGRLATRKWEDKEGIERYTTEVVASSLVSLGAKGDASDGGEDGDGGEEGSSARSSSSSYSSGKRRRAGRRSNSPKRPDPPEDEDNGRADDIPF